MRINPQILHIPPYISAYWRHIAHLRVEPTPLTPIMVVTLTNGVEIKIPGLTAPIIEAIFAAHAVYAETELKRPLPFSPPVQPNAILPNGQLQTTSFTLPLPPSIDPAQMQTLTQHNPTQADAPDLPIDFIEKIKTLPKAMGILDPNTIPQAEPHCNCTHCQVARALKSGIEDADNPSEPTPSQEEIVSDEDLQFRTWDITQTAENLFTVQSPLEPKENYRVYLGNPIGCTCGEKHCEHIRAVLSS